jgi:hypothetical protein
MFRYKRQGYKEDDGHRLSKMRGVRRVRGSRRKELQEGEVIQKRREIEKMGVQCDQRKKLRVQVCGSVVSSLVLAPLGLGGIANSG